MSTFEERLLTKVKKSSEGGCWKWIGSKDRKGYGRIWNGARTCFAHRASFELFCGPIPDGMHVCHRCDNPCCVNPKHLFLGTQADNMADRDAKGRQACQRGASNNRAKLTDSDVLAIRESKEKQRLIAQRFGVSQQIVSCIRTNKRWVHL